MEYVPAILPTWKRVRFHDRHPFRLFSPGEEAPLTWFRVHKVKEIAHRQEATNRVVRKLNQSIFIEMSA